MDSLPQFRETRPSLLSILSSSPGLYRIHHNKQSSGSPAVSMPGLDLKDDVPQPPPRHIPFLASPARPEKSMDELRDYGRSASFVQVGYGNLCSSLPDERPDSGSSVNGNESYASYTAAERSVATTSPVHDLVERDGSNGIVEADLNTDSLDYRPAEFMRHDKVYFQTAADLHGDSMKNKLDPIRRFVRSPRSVASSTLIDQAHRQLDPRALRLSIPIKLPIHSNLLFETPSRMSKTFILSDVSHRPALVRHFPGEQRMPKDGLDYVCSRRGHSWQNNTGHASSTHGNYEFAAAEDMETHEATAPKRFQPGGAYAAIDRERGAASPLAEYHLIHGGSTDPQRDLSSLDSSIPRLTVMPKGSSVSARSSAAISRFNSYISTMSTGPSAVTTAASFGNRSLRALSPCGASPTSCNSPYMTPGSVVLTSRTSISVMGETYERNISSTGSRKLAGVQKSRGSKVQRVYLCGCCPKKRKKFETAEDLSTHEAEKQYGCPFCGNRFKNKNEIERHLNSLHVRRHSWSCSALSGYDQTFHDSTSHAGEADTCSYCGVEFPRSGNGLGNESLTGGIAPKHATDQDWDDRIRHLQEVHKFRECNSSKKFYRADHFRQHLKHIHAGANGKWTNKLENACKMEEDPGWSPDQLNRLSTQSNRDRGAQRQSSRAQSIRPSIELNR
ncbi:C2H2 finger domain-containing protein [Pochonia chlamydosporia 170]|uniref:C2H2 finger domain-containing protein n=1 Tax=Pochonia chlamydosporia 170 TaxID=1380566 RepID=A0A179EZ34_METCM|nr:C2H2 finger domain-containing protein [Pochonia chlamydosporia 170]OAQ58455.2 C2H2 finger domain-containing protein [Pochonia chlamydosporia 170]